MRSRARGVQEQRAVRWCLRDITGVRDPEGSSQAASAATEGSPQSAVTP